MARLRASLLAAVLGAAAAKSAAPPPAPPCSLNGVLDAAGACVCDAPWIGAECELLDERPGHAHTRL